MIVMNFWLLYQSITCWKLWYRIWSIILTCCYVGNEFRKLGESFQGCNGMNANLVFLLQKSEAIKSAEYLKAIHTPFPSRSPLILQKCLPQPTPIYTRMRSTTFQALTNPHDSSRSSLFTGCNNICGKHIRPPYCRSSQSFPPISPNPSSAFQPIHRLYNTRGNRAW